MSVQLQTIQGKFRVKRNRFFRETVNQQRLF